MQDQCCFYDNLNKNIEVHIIEKDNRIVLGVDIWGANVDVNANYYQYTRPNRKSASSKHTLSGPQMTDSGLLMHYQPYS